MTKIYLAKDDSDKEEILDKLAATTNKDRAFEKLVDMTSCLSEIIGGRTPDNVHGVIETENGDIQFYANFVDNSLPGHINGGKIYELFIWRGNQILALFYNGHWNVEVSPEAQHLYQLIMTVYN